MSALLLAASGVYVIIKWKVILPQIATGISETVGNEHTAASTFALLAGTAAFNAYAVTLQDPLIAYTHGTTVAVAGILFSILGVIQADSHHWRISALHLVIYNSIWFARTTNSSNWYVFTVLSAVLYVSTVAHYFSVQ